MNKKLGNIFKGDKGIWMVFFFLCLISIVEVYSASSSLTYKGGNYLSPIIKHIGILAVGIFFMVMTLNVRCKYFKIGPALLIPISFLTLLWVFFAGQSTNGAQRWISLFGFQFQPSEIAKGTLVLSVAQILSAMQGDNGADKNAIKYIFWVWLALVPLIALENLSTAVLISFVIFLMMFIGQVPKAQLGKLMGGTFILVALIVATVLLVGNDVQPQSAKTTLTENVQTAKAETQKSTRKGPLHRMDTWKSRIVHFLDDKQVPPEEVDLDKDGQVAHANIAVATSHVIGKGPGNSTERDFLSQAFSDFIYSIIIEELGIGGAVVVMLLYLILLYRTGRIASRCENNFPAFLAMGLALLLVVQALFNMAVAVGLVPVTGQPLPLISKGGTSSITNCIYIGVILSVSRSAKRLPSIDDDNLDKAISAA